MRVNRRTAGIAEQSAKAADSAFVRRIATLLVGVAAGWLMVAIANQIASAFRCAQPIGLPVMSACLAVMALGVRLPQRVAGLLRRPNRQGRRETAPDRQLLWTILAASAMLAGLGIAVIPVTARAGAWAYAAATDHFFWLNATHVLLVILLTVMVVAVPLVLVGVVLVCLNQLARLAPRSSRSVTPQLLAAAAVGSALSSRFSEVAPRTELLVVTATLPFFAVAILAVRRAGASSHPELDDSRILPAVGVRQSAGTVESVVTIATIATAGIVVTWSWLLATQFGAAGAYWVLCAAALGLSGVPARRLGEGFGVAMPIALAGLFGNVAAMTIALMGSTIGVVAACITGALTVFAVTRAIGHARRRVLERTASPNATATRFLFECLWWPGVALLLLAFFLPTERECHWWLIGLALTIAAAGAVALLDDAARAVGRRWLSAALVLAVAMGLTVWMPWAASRLTQTDVRFSMPRPASTPPPDASSAF